ncbi:MAG TPA: sulfotransferase family 2 domain-containing protein [Blastocatellia bacterium]|nr:sulfotransferase family 2 domain-containing protein [Blastocatellia bacterium]
MLNPPWAVQQKEHAPGLHDAFTIMTRRHFSPFKVFLSREHHTVVVLNPKVGSTTFRNITQRAYREVLGRKNLSGGCYRLFKNAHKFPIAPLSDYAHAFSHPHDYKFYCFVRNPYARLKSAWQDKLAFGHVSGYPRSIRGKLVADIRRFARQQDLPGQKEDTAIPFSTFVNYIDSQEAGRRNHHWDEQYSVLLMDHISYTQVFKMETQFNEGVKHVFGSIGIPENWIEGALSERCNHCQQAAEGVFDEQLASSAQRIFARDFSTFSYDVESWRRL